METHFDSRFSFNIWCGINGRHVIGPFVLEVHLTFEHYLRFLEDELRVLIGFPFLTRRERWLQQNGAFPHFGRQVTAFLNQLFKIAELGGSFHLVGHRGHLT
jgi:hypothetical protein